MGKVFDLAQHKHRNVKNLGWLLKNWKKVECIQWFNSTVNPMVDGFFLARCDGKVYYSDFASYTVFLNWIDRPIFRGLPLYIHKGNVISSDTKPVVIGSPEFRAIKGV